MKSLSDQKCPICQDTISNPIKLGCDHVFCDICIATWFVLYSNNKYFIFYLLYIYYTGLLEVAAVLYVEKILNQTVQLIQARELYL